MLVSLFTKELAMLVLIAAAGTGFARELRGRLDAGSQLALTPIFGFAATIALLTTVNFFVPLRWALWFALIPLALASIVFAIWRAGIPRDLGRHKKALVQVAIVVIGTLAILNVPLHKRDSAGPIGWGIFDAPGYTDCIAGFANHTNKDPLVDSPTVWYKTNPGHGVWKPLWNMSERYCWEYKFSHEGGMTLPSVLAKPTGWLPWEMLSPYMALCVLLVGLGAFALFRTLTRSRGWLAVAPGLAMAGAPLFQLYIDGSAGLLGALAFMPALLTLGVLVFERSTWRVTILGAVLAAGLMTAYPEMGVVAAGTLLLALLVELVRGRRAGRPYREMVKAALPKLAAAAALIIAVAPRAALWAWADLKATGGLSKGAIDYEMQFLHLPGWLFQTREFYTFSLSHPSGFTYVVVGILLPLVLIAVAVYGLSRVRRAWLLVGFIAVASIQALYSSTALDCSYCVGRTMLTTVPPIAVLVTIGIYELTRQSIDWRLVLGGALGAAAVIAATASLVSIESRAIRGAYMPPNELSQMSEEAEKVVDGPLQLEGFGQTPLWAWGEGRTTYQAMAEATEERVSVDSAYNDYGGLSYFATRAIGDPTYTPDYKYVLTRLTSLDTGRPVIAQYGPFILQRRTRPFDATVARGVAVETFLRDPAGIAWLQEPGEELSLQQGPLTFWVSALHPAKAYLRVELVGGAPAPENIPGATMTRRPGEETNVCMPVPGRGKLRVAKMPLNPLPGGLEFPPGVAGSATLPDENAPLVPHVTRLNKVRVSTIPCTDR